MNTSFRSGHTFRRAILFRIFANNLLTDHQILQSSFRPSIDSRFVAEIDSCDRNVSVSLLISQRRSVSDVLVGKAFCLCLGFISNVHIDVFDFTLELLLSHAHSLLALSSLLETLVPQLLQTRTDAH